MFIIYLRSHTTIMKIIAFLSCLILVKSGTSSEDFIIDGVRHYREILYENLTLGYYSALAVDYTTNDLYISSNMAKFNLNTREHEFITGIRNVQAINVDQETRNVYVATSSGIYSYNVTTKTSELVGARGYDIMWVYVKNVLYYSKYSTGEIYTLANEISKKFDNMELTIRNFVVDKDDNVVCVCTDRKLYTLKKGTKHLVFYRGISVNMVTTDKNGNVYVTAQDGIYKVKMSSSTYVATIDKVLSIENPRDIVFDNESNIVYYSTKDSKIYTFKPVSRNATNICSNRDDSHHDDSNDSISSKIDHLAQIILTLQTKVDKLQTDIKGGV